MEAVLTPRKSLARESSLNALVLAITLAVLYAATEAYISMAIDDGMQFDLEMWRYARYIKRQSANPAIGHEHTPNSRAHLMGADVAISSQGLRDREFPLAPPAGGKRILMLGDSLAFGWGVPGERTYSKRLEALLRHAGYDAEVINTGVGNYNTEMQVAYFFERGHQFKPQYVVLNYFINDAEPTPRYGTTGFLAQHSRAYVYFASRVDAALRQLSMAGKADWRGYYGSLYSPEGIGRVRAAVERLAHYCRTHGIKLYIANYPELRNPREYPFPQVDAAIEKIAAGVGVPYVPMLPAVRDLEPSSLWVTRPDPHPSVLAHDAFAGELFRLFDAEFRR